MILLKFSLMGSKSYIVMKLIESVTKTNKLIRYKFDFKLFNYVKMFSYTRT